MDYLIFSDSHGRRNALLDVVQRQIQPPAAVFFAGDGLRDLEVLEGYDLTVHAVAGNCDWMALEEQERLILAGGLRVLLTHGHLYGVKSGYSRLIARGASLGVDVILFGHTHQPHYERLEAGMELGTCVLAKPLHLFNPGSVTEGSFGTLTVQNGQVLLSHGRL